MYQVYSLIKDGLVVYVGMSKNVKQRISAHKQDKEFDNYGILVKGLEYTSAMDCERKLIKILKPKYNILQNDDKHLRVKFTTMLKPEIRDNIQNIALNKGISGADVLETIIKEYLSFNVDIFKKENEDKKGKSFTFKDMESAPTPEPGLTKKGRVKFTTMLRPEIKNELQKICNFYFLTFADVIEKIVIYYFNDNP